MTTVLEFIALDAQLLASLAISEAKGDNNSLITLALKNVIIRLGLRHWSVFMVDGMHFIILKRFCF